MPFETKEKVESKKKDQPVKAKIEAKAMPTAPKDWSPPTNFQVDKNQLGKADVGSEISVTIKGEIVSIRKVGVGIEGERNASMLEVEISSPKVSHVESNSADVEMKRIINTR